MKIELSKEEIVLLATAAVSDARKLLGWIEDEKRSSDWPTGEAIAACAKWRKDAERLGDLYERLCAEAGA